MKNLSKFLSTLSFMLMLSLAVSISTVYAQGEPAEGETVIDVMESNEETTGFAKMLDKSGYAQILKEPGPYTILAPSNEALKNNGIDTENLPADQAQLQQMVQSHLYQGSVPQDQVENQMGVSIKDTDESPSNGVVYIVDDLITE
ncbi:MAG: fasciclin domain-containing protein [Bacteroidota bacterium]